MTLTEARKSAGLTLRAAAHELCVEPKVLADLEHGHFRGYTIDDPDGLRAHAMYLYSTGKLKRRHTCIDCAFHNDSPEREPGTGGIAAEGGSLVDVIVARVRAGNFAAPFYCHRWMPRTAPEPGNYEPKLSANGSPACAPLCVGYAMRLT